ncbi:MAG: Uma2 family endonuclease [Planctomycetota bacterium]|nr:MAG: Uma2 family endonuclease [Planctomycetota bacterium]
MFMSIITTNEPAILEPPQQTLMTVEEFLAIPDDENIERDLIRGVVKERVMTRRSRRHALTEAKITYFLMNWVQVDRHGDGKVYSGEVGCILRHAPSSTVGIDVAYITAEHAARQTDATRLIEGAPALAVQILSPNDTQESIAQKIDEYLACGVQLVWIADPHFRTITVHRPSMAPEFFAEGQTLYAENELPGFSVLVRNLFE